MYLRLRMELETNGSNEEIEKLVSDSFKERFNASNFLGVCANKEGAFLFDSTPDSSEALTCKKTLCVPMTWSVNEIRQYVKVLFDAKVKGFERVAYKEGLPCIMDTDFKPLNMNAEIKVEDRNSNVVIALLILPGNAFTTQLEQAVKRVGLKPVQQALPALTYFDIGFDFTPINRKDYHINEFKTILY